MYSNWLQNKFFIITPENCADIEDALYGFAISGNDIHIGTTRPAPAHFDALTPGSFVCIANDGDSLIISQDHTQSFGIYYYREGGWWAISNSLLYLAQFLLKQKRKISINEEFTAAFMMSLLTTDVAIETIFTEIQELGKDFYIVIDKNARAMAIGRTDTQTESVDLVSGEAIKLLDNWQHKYASLANSIAVGGFQIRYDLSGGYDSRAALATMPKDLPIKYANVNLYSAQDGTKSHVEDFTIASRIADIYKYQLNGEIEEEAFDLTPMDAVKGSFYAKLGNNRQIYFKDKVYRHPVFAVGGMGGECVRNRTNFTFQEYLADIRKMGFISGFDFFPEALPIITRSMEFIKASFNESTPDSQRLYNHTLGKNHFGRATAESYFGNIIVISPLLDPELYKIKLASPEVPDRNALFALIYHRYQPELAHVPYVYNKNIAPATKQAVAEFNGKFPYQPRGLKEFGIKISPESIITECATDKSAYLSPRDYMVNLYMGREARNFITRKYSDRLYNDAYQKYVHERYYGDHSIMTILQIYMACQIAEGKNLDEIFTLAPYENKAGIESLLAILSKGRIRLQAQWTNHSFCEIRHITPLEIEQKPNDNYGWDVDLVFNHGFVAFKLAILRPSVIKFTFLPAANGNAGDNNLPPLKADFHNIKIIDVTAERLLYSCEAAPACEDGNTPALEINAAAKHTLLVSFDMRPFNYSAQELAEIINSLVEDGLLPLSPRSQGVLPSYRKNHFRTSNPFNF